MFKSIFLFIYFKVFINKIQKRIILVNEFTCFSSFFSCKVNFFFKYNLYKDF